MPRDAGSLVFDGDPIGGPSGLSLRELIPGLVYDEQYLADAHRFAVRDAYVRDETIHVRTNHDDVRAHASVSCPRLDVVVNPQSAAADHGNGNDGDGHENSHRCKQNLFHVNSVPHHRA